MGKQGQKVEFLRSLVLLVLKGSLAGVFLIAFQTKVLPVLLPLVGGRTADISLESFLQGGLASKVIAFLGFFLMGMIALIAAPVVNGMASIAGSGRK